MVPKHRSDLTAQAAEVGHLDTITRVIRPQSHLGLQTSPFGREEITAQSLLHFKNVISGIIDESATVWLQRGLENFLKLGLPLHRCLGLPNFTRLRTELRNFWLADAFVALGGSVTQFYQVAKKFERDLWPQWCELTTPPLNATSTEGGLFYARRAAAFPTSRRAFANILPTYWKRNA